MLNLINLKQFAKNKLFATSLLSVSCLGLLATTIPLKATTTEPIATIAPGSVNKEMGVAQTIELERTVTLDLSALVQTIVTPAGTVMPQKLDVLFLADNTYTMQAPIDDVISNASTLLTTLNNTYGTAAGGDMQVGVAFYRGDPTEYGDAGEVFELADKPNKPDGSAYTLGYGASPETFNKTYEFIESYYNSWGYRRYKYRKNLTNSAGELVQEDIVTSRYYYNDSQLASFASSFSGAPVEHQAYQLLDPVDGGTIADAEAAIGQWYSQAESDNDAYPEGNFFALHQAATSGAAISGYSTGYNTQWRADSDKRIIIIFGDAESITDAANLTETINALNAQNITVVAINVQDNGTPEWAEFNSDGQFYSTNSNATTITSATNGVYADSYSNTIATTMLDLIGTVAMVETPTTTVIQPDPVDIFLRTAATTPVPEGLTVSYACIDPHPDQCNNVADGESRKFKMIVTGVNPGDYSFDTEVFDVNTDNSLVDADNQIILRKVD